MATLQERDGSYRVPFRHGGRRYAFTIGKVEPREVELVATDVDRVPLWIQQRLLKVAPGVDLVAFVRSGGQASVHLPASRGTVCNPEISEACIGV